MINIPLEEVLDTEQLKFLVEQGIGCDLINSIKDTVMFFDVDFSEIKEIMRLTENNFSCKIIDLYGKCRMLGVPKTEILGRIKEVFSR